MSTLTITHSHGFFSCCSVRLHDIIQYYNSYKSIPQKVDSLEQFKLYKYDDTKDVTFDFFEHYDSVNVSIVCEQSISITCMCYQFDNYRNVNYTVLLPFVTKYFTPSTQIINNCNNLIQRYNINTENCIGVYYRGTDKMSETKLGHFDSYSTKLKELLDKTDDNIQILLQTDSAQFREYMTETFPNKIIVLQENATSYTSRGMHYERTPTENYTDMQNLMATFILLSKCKYLMCSSGNCSIWMMFFREHTENVYQHLNDVWLH
jgi:hypothetical protein